MPLDDREPIAAELGNPELLAAACASVDRVTAGLFEAAQRRGYALDDESWGPCSRASRSPST
jgi:hypothetical protein